MAFGKKGKEKAAQAASSAAPAALSEDVSELDAGKLYSEDPIEVLLDEQSDEEFGDLQLKERAGSPVKLAEWSAQDFSSIYLRFRPHLERHARRFLNNPSQVDEVVQDAFLYLMVSLPELDSEIGVLRFLKWKTRLLALDVIRASGRAYINSIDDVKEPESNDPEISSSLEQQDDAAVVRLALSKLNPRHREVLIASMYEEKSTEEIAAQVGLSENATRQLMFRARAAFKKALIGDVDTTGMSATAILSVAARKAASEGKKIGASAMALVALVAMTLSIWPSMSGTRNQDNVAGAPELSQPLEVAPPVDNPYFETPDSPPIAAPEDGSSDASSASGSAQVSPEASEPSASGDSAARLTPNPANDSSSSGTNSSATSEPAEAISSPAFSSLVSGAQSANFDGPITAQDALSERYLAPLFETGFIHKPLLMGGSYHLISPTGLSMRFSFGDPESEKSVSSVRGSLEIGGYRFTFAPGNFVSFKNTLKDGPVTHVFEGSVSSVLDSEGRRLSLAAIANDSLSLEVFVDALTSEVTSVRYSFQRY